jgi:hypothetical protein
MNSMSTDAESGISIDTDEAIADVFVEPFTTQVGPR